MTSYISLLNKIEAFCNAHLQIKKYKGEFKEQMPNFSTINEKYPIVFIVPTLDSETLELNQFTLDIYCVDIIQKDRANLNTIVSDCHLILKDLYLYFKDGSDLSVDVIADPTMTPLNNFDLDYVAGWVMTITFEVEGYSVCAIPMNPIPPFIPGCDDATYTITDSALTTLYSGSIVSGGDLDQPIQDSEARLKDTLGTTISTTNILAEGSEDIVAPDSTYLVEYQNGTDIQSGSIVSGGSVTVTVPNPISCADTTIEVNGTTEGTFSSGSTIDVQLSDSGGVVTPDSVTVVGNDVQIVLADAVVSVTRSTATLLKTGQTVSHGDYDDGFYELGRNTNFFTLDAVPIHNDGTPTINTTTNRFTDVLGGQTYTNNIMLDWSTWNGLTLKGWVRSTNGGNVNWTTARTGAAAVSIGAFTTNWALPNITELQSLSNYGVTSGTTLNYAPLIAADAAFSNSATIIWCGTTVPTGTTNAYGMIQGAFGIYAKTSAARWMACRTFSLSLLNVLS